MNDDADVLELPSKFSIEALMKQAAARAAETGTAEAVPEPDEEDEPADVPSLDKLSPLPQPGDPYKAYARAAGRPQVTLMHLRNDGTMWGYPYACLVDGPRLVPANDAAKNLMLRLVFSGHVNTEVTLTGRRLEQLTNFLANHRVAWVREQAKGKFTGDDNAPVITGITIKEIK